MKQFKLLSLLAFLFFSPNLFANVFTVNNSNPSPGQFTTLAAAIVAASDGDTLMVAGTDISYGDVLVNKSVTILGPGWVVSGGGISRVALFGTITFTNSNTSFIGIRFLRLATANSLATFVTNVKVQRCIIDDEIDASSDDWTNSIIEGCIFSEFNGYNITSGASSVDYIGCTIRNNIFSGYIFATENTNISNNIFLGGSGATQICSANVINGTFTGNIVINRIINSVLSSNNVSGNLSWSGSSSWVQLGNLTDLDPLFVVSPTTTSLHSWLFDYHLQAGSPAIGTGPGGDDVGVYAGDGVYRQDGEPSVPIVRAVNVPGGGVVPANATFNINVISVAHE